MKFFNYIFLSTVFLFLSACGGGDSGSTNNTPSEQEPKTVTLTGKAVFNPNGGSTKPIQGLHKSSNSSLYTILDGCVTEYQAIYSSLTPNKDTANGVLNRTRTVTVNSNQEEFIAMDIDANNDDVKELNIEVSNIPDFEYVEFLNFDSTCDGVADINIDTDGNGVPNLNIDQNADGVGDFDLASGTATTVAGAEVSVVEPPEEVYSSTTNDSGEFTITNVVPDQYGIEIVKPGVPAAKVSQKMGKQMQTLTVWNRSPISVSNEDTDLGVYALDSAPYPVKVVVDGTTVRTAEYGSRHEIVSDPDGEDLFTGLTHTYEFYYVDPNGLDMYAYIGYYDENHLFTYKQVSTLPVANEPNQRKLTLTISLHDNFYKVNFNNGEYVADRMPMATTPNVFTWNSIEFFNFSFPVANTDGINVSASNSMGDIINGVTFNNNSYTGTPQSFVLPQVISVAANGTVYTNPTPAADSDFHVDIGDVTHEDAITLTVDVLADEDYPIEYHWSLPYGMTAQPSGNTLTFNVNELPRVYGVSPYDDINLYVGYEGTTGAVAVTIASDVDGGREPAECVDIKINGATNTENTLYFSGQTVIIQPVISDPFGLPTEYAIRLSGKDIPWTSSFITGYNETTGEIQWVSSTETISYTFVPEDTVDMLGIQVFCRNNDGFRMSGGSNSTDDALEEPLNVSQ